MTTLTTSPEFGKLKDLAKTIMSQKQWDAASLVSLAGSLAAEVNKLVSLSGSQKKDLVLDVIKSVFQEAVEKASPPSPLASPETVKSLMFVLDFAVPASLDLAVAAARGKLDLKKVKMTAVRGCFLCLPFLLKAGGASSQQAQVIESVAKQLAPSESDKTTPQTEPTQEKASETETPQRKNSLVAGVVLRVPEGAPPSGSQVA